MCSTTRQAIRVGGHKIRFCLTGLKLEQVKARNRDRPAQILENNFDFDPPLTYCCYLTVSAVIVKHGFFYFYYNPRERLLRDPAQKVSKHSNIPSQLGELETRAESQKLTLFSTTEPNLYVPSAISYSASI